MSSGSGGRVRFGVRVLIAAVVVAAAVPVLGASAQATTPTCTSNFVGGNGGSWSVPANWSPVGVPTSTSIACAFSGSLDISTPATAAQVVMPGVAVTVDAGASLALGAGNSSFGGLTLDGSLRLRATTLSPGFLGSDAGASVDTGTGPNASTVDLCTQSGDPLHVSGAGTFTFAATQQSDLTCGGGFVFDGPVTAEATSSRDVGLDVAAGTSAAGRVQVDSGAFAGLSDTGVLIAADPSSTVELGGTFVPAAGQPTIAGAVRLQGATISGDTHVAGAVLVAGPSEPNVVSAGATLTVDGPITYNETYAGGAVLQVDGRLNGGGSLSVDTPDAILRGSGTVTLPLTVASGSVFWAGLTFGDYTQTGGETIWTYGAGPTHAQSVAFTGGDLDLDGAAQTADGTTRTVLIATTLNGLPPSVNTHDGAMAFEPVISGATLTATTRIATVQMTLTASASTVQVGQPITFTARVSPTEGTIDGEPVSFFDNGVPLGTTSLNAGVAVLVATLPQAATVTIAAGYAGDVVHDGVGKTASIVVTPAPTPSPSSAPTAVTPAQGGVVATTKPVVMSEIREKVAALGVSISGRIPAAGVVFTRDRHGSIVGIKATVSLKDGHGGTVTVAYRLARHGSSWTGTVTVVDVHLHVNARLAPAKTLSIKGSVVSGVAKGWIVKAGHRRAITLQWTL